MTIFKTDEVVRDMAKEAWIRNRIKELEEEIEYHKLQGCGYAIGNYLGPELIKHKAMLNEL